MINPFGMTFSHSFLHGVKFEGKTSTIKLDAARIWNVRSSKYAHDDTVHYSHADKARVAFPPRIRCHGHALYTINADTPQQSKQSWNDLEWNALSCLFISFTSLFASEHLTIQFNSIQFIASQYTKQRNRTSSGH